MDYQVLDIRTGRPVETLELHVIARAYFAAWKAVHGAPPLRRHPLPGLGIEIDYRDHNVGTALSGQGWWVV